MYSETVNKASKGIVWSYIEQFGRLFIRFVISIFLARILMPEDFGLIGMIAVFINVSQVFVDSGFGTALIQKKDCTNTDESTIFYFNLISAIIIYFILFFTAPLVARFYAQPILQKIIRMFSLSIVFGSLGSIHNLLLTKAVSFKEQSVVSIISSVVSGILGILLAYLGYGVWSLVIMTIIERLVNSILLWFVSNWRPRSKFSLSSLKTLFAYGSKILFNKSLDKIFENIFELIIGKAYNPTALGFYTRAKGYYSLASQSVISSFIRVAFPSFCELQNNPTELRRALAGSIRIVFFILAPIIAILIITAEPLIVTLIGNKWLQAVPYLKLMSLFGLFLPFNALNRLMLNAIGRSDLFLRIGIIEKILIVIVLFISTKYGINIMILAQVLFVSVPVLFINGYYSGKFLKYNTWKQIKDVVHIFTITLFSGGISFLIKYLITNDFFLLCTQTVVLIFLYLATAYLFKFKELLMLLDRIKQLKK